MNESIVVAFGLVFGLGTSHGIHEYLDSMYPNNERFSHILSIILLSILVLVVLSNIFNWINTTESVMNTLMGSTIAIVSGFYILLYLLPKVFSAQTRMEKIREYFPRQ
mgnify:CR=1 FL=1